MKRSVKLILLIGLFLASVVVMRATPVEAQTSMNFPSAIVLDWELDPTGVSQTVTIYAFVIAVDPILGGIPTGQVEFFLAGTSLGASALQPANGYAVTTFLVKTLGDVPAVTATYLGDASFSQSVSGAPAP
jgi:hypothetical protein